jgi:Dolichyl-phosphate-mannose-protein mannosyltransferase
MAGHHLAFGYVDQPPLIPLLTRITGITGVSPTAVRVIPAPAGGPCSGRAGSAGCSPPWPRRAPVLLAAAHLGNTTVPELPAWAVVLLCVSTALLRDRRRRWLGGGAAAGARLETNNLMLMLLAGLGMGILVSAHRFVLRTRWPWLGAEHHLGAEHRLAGRARVAATGHGLRPAPGKRLGGRLRGRAADPDPVPGAAGRAAGHRGLHQAMAHPRAAVPGRRGHAYRGLRGGLGADPRDRSPRRDLGPRRSAPTSILTGYYGESAALDVLGSADHLPRVLSGHNTYWMSGPASDRTVLMVDALSQLRPCFASCRQLTTYHAPYRVQNDWTGLQIGVCTGPVAGWPALWPHLKHYG